MGFHFAATGGAYKQFFGLSPGAGGCDLSMWSRIKPFASLIEAGGCRGSKHEDETLYLVRETKSTKDFLKLRTTEADKVRFGEQHFKALDVPFAVVVDDAGV